MSILVRWCVAAVVTLAGVVFVRVFGPFELVRGWTPTGIMAPDWYMVSAFPVFGLLVADLAQSWRLQRMSRPTVILALQIGAMTVLSGTRLSSRIPLSGHALLFAFFVLERSLAPRPWPPAHAAELALGAVLLVGVVAIKLAWWADPLTLGVGLLLAAVTVAAGRVGRFSAS